MKKFITGFIILIVILVIGLLALPSLIPSSVYKENIETQLTRELAREVRVQGDVKLSVFPVIKANTGRVEIDNPEGFTQERFAQMDAMSARIKLIPLFSKRVEIASFSLKNPSINLEKRADGQTNWAFNQNDAPAPELVEDGPFKRDGRYSSIDPKIGDFSLENGKINYSDAQAGTGITISDVNLDFSLPGLSEPVEIDGALTYNGTPAELGLTLDSPRSFLDGQEAPISLSLKTDFTDISAKGRFLAGEDITFEMDIDGDISDVSKLAALSPREVPYVDKVQSAKISGNYGYNGTVITARNADLSATGADFSAAFKGDATLAETPIFDGQIKLDAKNVSALAKGFGQDIKGLSLIQTVKLTADLAQQSSGFKANNIDAALTGDGLDGIFKGTGQFGETITVNGIFNADVKSISKKLAIMELDMPQAKILDALTASGTIDVSGTTYKVINLETKITGDGLSGSYKGAATYGEALSADGSFTADISSVADIATALELELPEAKALQSLKASGNVSMAGDTIRLTNLDTKTEGGVLSGSYKGGASLGGTPAFDGNFDVALSSLTEFAAITAKDIPYAETIGRIAINGAVSGQGQAITLPTLTAALTDGKINGRYEGKATWNKGASLNGTLNIDIPSLRDVAAANGTELPPSTNSGDIFGPFSVNGTVKGTPDDITFNQAAISLDNIKGQGNFSVDMVPSTPMITGTLNLDGLDLAPYMAAYSAQNPTGEIQPWSTTPINTAALRAIDGDFTLNTPNIKTDRMTMGQSTIMSKLRSGVMTTNMPNIALYGGLGRMVAVLDGSKAEPQVSLDIDLNDLNSNSFLASVAGFTQAQGDLASSFKISGRGTSQAAIMKSLSGAGDFKLVEGQLSGVDISALLTGLDQALTNRSIPTGIGPSHITKFNDLIGLVEIKNGVASIDKFSLKGLGVLAEGSGQIDLGNQSIDFGLRPRLTGESASNIAAFGIPIEIKGGFGSAKVGLDSDMLGQIATERARAEASKLIKNQVGGTVGNILGGVVGGNSETETSKNGEAIIGDVLGGILGGKKIPDETSTETKEEQKLKTEEPSVEDTLLNIFGKKKKKADSK